MIKNGVKVFSRIITQVGLDKENVSRDTRLLYCTTGMFKKMVIGKKSLSEWTHIILDEVHEREMDLDFALMLCKQVNCTAFTRGKSSVCKSFQDQSQSWVIVTGAPPLSRKNCLIFSA